MSVNDVKIKSLKDENAAMRRRIAELEELETKHKAVEKELRESEALYRTLIETSPDAIIMFSPDGTMMAASAQTAVVYGVSTVDEFLREVKTVYDILTEEGRKMVAVDIERTLREGHFYKHEYIVKIRDGSLIPMEINASVVWDASGEPRAFICVARDVTERKQAEDELRDREEKYRLVVENASEAIIVAKMGILSFVNQATMKLAGYAQEDLIGRPLTDFIHPDDMQMVYDNHMKRLRQEEVPPVYSFRIITKNGDVRWAEIHAVNIMWKNEEATLNFLEDITERRQAEKEKGLLQERLLRAQKMEALGLLAGGVAHDLNNVLGILVGYSEYLLLQLPRENPLRNHVNQILKGGQRAAAIIQDLLTLTRRGVQVSEIVNLNGIIADYLQTPEYELLKARHTGVEFKMALDTELLNIKGSPVHLTKTVMNLITNAFEAIKTEGVVAIKTGNRHVDKPIPGYDNTQEGDYAVLTVSDTGAGIAAADLPRIFEPFYTKKVMGRSGTGLGLAVVWGTVKDHDGYIDVASKDGKGSVFTLYFPVSRSEMTQPEKAVDLETYLGRGERILVVDDMEGQRTLASDMLGSIGYNVDAVASGEEAVDFIKNQSADLVILDMIMDPGIDGLETYRRMLGVRPGQKAIIVSGFAQTERVMQAQALGAGEYVRKPYLLEKLGLAVRKELDR